MRIRLYLLTVLVCVIALSATAWSSNPAYDRQNQVNNTPNDFGSALDDHPWGDDQSIAQPRPTNDINVKSRVAAATKFQMFLVQSRLYFIDLMTPWTFGGKKNTTTQPGTTTGTVPTTNNSTNQ